jgi:hypothetical protein
MNIFVITLLTGLASNYVSEIIALICASFMDRKLSINVSIPVVSFIFILISGLTGATLVVAGFAASFIASALRLLLDVVTSKPQPNKVNKMY